MALYSTTSGTITGPTHVKRGEESQDSLATHTGPEGTIIAVADGAGSLTNSKEGSQLAVNTVIALGKRLLRGDALEEIPVPPNPLQQEDSSTTPLLQALALVPPAQGEKPQEEAATEDSQKAAEATQAQEMLFQERENLQEGVVEYDLQRVEPKEQATSEERFAQEAPQQVLPALGGDALARLRLGVLRVLYGARAELLALEDFSTRGCTLAFALVLPDGSYGVGVVGDAFAVLHENTGEHALVMPQRKSEYANITELLTSKEIHPRVQCGAGPLRGVSVATDGLLHSGVQGEHTPSAGFWTPLLVRAETGTLDVEDFLSFLESRARIDDDTTLAMATQLTQAPSA